jgi:NAD(P)-dependent dehydrogenase (short-subunit alcohol dehydrogenase family)
LTAELGPLTALVNNASLFEPDSKDPDGKLHMAINAEAPHLLSEAFHQHMPVNQAGAIVHLLDGTPPESHLSFYGASKQRLQKDMLDQARRFAPRVRVNGIAPGPILPNSRQSDQHFTAQVESTLLKTRLSPENIASTVGFLLFNPGITGQVIHVDGGLFLNN